MSPFDVLIPYARQNPNWETKKAESLFEGFVSKGFSYDKISDKPDYMVYASASLLKFILPKMIDEMLFRGNTDNFLIYPMITAIDPYIKKIEAFSRKKSRQEDNIIYQERARELASIVNQDVVEKICAFLDVLKEDPPVPVERLEQLLRFWNSKLGVIWLQTKERPKSDDD